jgi:parvulin-like peptidyl-prolyl isomerase
MMMKMRQKLTWVMMLLVAAFLFTIFLEWGAGGAGALGTQGLAGQIGDMKLTSQDFTLRVNQALKQYEERSGQKYPDAQLETFRKQIWDQLVTEYVINKELEKRSIESTDSEFVYASYNDPVPQIKNNPQLQTNGVFDKNKLRQIVAQNPNLAYQLDYFFRTTYPQRVMKFFVDNSITVSNAEVLESYRKDNLKANLRYLGVPKARLATSDFAVSDEEIASYYNANKEDYKEDEKRKIEYIRLDVEASVEDTNSVIDELDEIKNRIITDELDFADEAKIESDDKLSGENGGKTGMVLRSTFSESFVATLTAAPKGQIIGPVFEGGRYLIAKLVEAKDDSINVQHITKLIYAGTTTIDNFDELAAQSILAAKEGNLATYAKENDINYNETAYFINNGNIPGIGRNAYLSDFIFKKSAGAVSRDVRLNQNRTIYVVKVVDIKPEGYQELTAVQARIKNIILNDKKGEKAKSLLSAVKTKLATSTFAEIAATEGLKSVSVTDTTGSVKYYDSFIRTIGKSPELVRFVTSAKSSDISDVILTNSGAFVVQLLSKVEFTQADFDSKKAAIRTKLQTQQLYNEFGRWLESAKENYDIEVYRLY